MQDMKAWLDSEKTRFDRLAHAHADALSNQRSMELL
jgi:hypothetical protein